MFVLNINIHLVILATVRLVLHSLEIAGKVNTCRHPGLVWKPADERSPRQNPPAWTQCPGLPAPRSDPDLTREKTVYTIDQITRKTPNPKCRLYWCLVKFID
jgi:hypothetical protein